jgi:hypothetical protein
MAQGRKLSPPSRFEDLVHFSDHDVARDTLTPRAGPMAFRRSNTQCAAVTVRNCQGCCI